MSRWDSSTNTSVEDDAVEAFLDDLVEVCRKHQMTLGHEDEHGAFQVLCRFSEANIRWLLAVHITRPNAEETNE
jgi:hypothetical protein